MMINVLLASMCLAMCSVTAFAFVPSTTTPSFLTRSSSASFAGTSTATSLHAQSTPPLKPRKKGYEPKWKKKETLADQLGSVPPAEVGLKGTLPVVFQQGNVTKTTMALPGQPLREVAIQAGQFIKYGCGKGECGTCECLVAGQWIRPCMAVMPASLPDGVDNYLVQVKQVKNKSKSSGKFYTARSFVMGFYNNLLGMVGFVQYRRAAKRNWQERQEYEDLIKRKTLEKKLAKQQADLEQQNKM